MFGLFRRRFHGRRAPDITGQPWFNIDSLPTAAQTAAKVGSALRFTHELTGRVTVIHFWDYTCVHCVRMLPHLREWWERYHTRQFMIIGVHTPEFDAGADPDSVEDAVLRFGLDYPVVSDSEYTTWQRYHTRVWPRTLVTDLRGIVRRDWSGEGQYAEAEADIVKFLDRQATGTSH